MSILFYSSVAIPIIKMAREHNCPIQFVKNNGVYLSVKVNNKTIIGYAKHCNPDVNEDYFFHTVQYLGSGHFVECLDPHQKIFDWIINCQLNLEISIKDEKIILSATRDG